MKKTLSFSLFSLMLLVSCKNSKVSLRAIDSVDRLTIAISGDFMQHTSQINVARVDADSFDYDTPLRHIKGLWSGVDFAIINLETTISRDSSRYSGYPMFCAPASTIGALSRAGIDAFALANNHSMDKGWRGVEETINEIEAAGLAYTGVGMDSVRALVMTKGRLKIALLNYTYSTNGMPTPKGVKLNMIDTVAIARDMVAARAGGATNVIVFYHWGDEYRTYPNKLQRELALWSRARGADVVVGSHPHVVQPIDGEHKIVYSLGNFVSNQSIPNTDVGISVRLTFCSGVGEPRIEFLPHKVDIADRYTIVPMRGGASEKIVRKRVKYE